MVDDDTNGGVGEEVTILFAAKSSTGVVLLISDKVSDSSLFVPLLSPLSSDSLQGILFSTNPDSV